MNKKKLMKNWKDLNRINFRNELSKRGESMRDSNKRSSSNRKLFDDKELEATYEETKEFFRKLKILGKSNLLS